MSADKKHPEGVSLPEVIHSSTMKQNPSPPRYEADSTGRHQPKTDNPEAHFLALTHAMGTANMDLSRMLISQMAQALEYDKDDLLNAALAFLHEQRPKDEIETFILCQAFCSHFLAMAFAAKAAIPAASELTERLVNMTTKMMRNFTTQIESLHRYRGNSGQRITVEHVTVNHGGQAIVGLAQCSDTGGSGNGQVSRSSRRNSKE